MKSFEVLLKRSSGKNYNAEEESMTIDRRPVEKVARDGTRKNSSSYQNSLKINLNI